MSGKTQPQTLNLRVRHAREVTDLNVPCREENFGYTYMDWPIPVSQSAVVLVDCWATHPVESFMQRADQIVREKIHPVVQAARSIGLPVIHGPAPQWVRNYPQSAAYFEERSVDQCAEPDWPPQVFRLRQRPYETFGAHKLWHEPTQIRYWEQNPKPSLRVHQLLEPTAEDFVIIDGNQLHRLCMDEGILHLIYAGFATNICVQYRDYGMRPMVARGYNVILIRDATTGIEFAGTAEYLALTQAAVHNIEMKVGPSITSRQMINACANEMT